MSRQESQKHGVRSEAQKQMRARDGYKPVPPANPVAGAFGEHVDDSDSDQELSQRLNEKSVRRSRADSKQA